MGPSVEGRPRLGEEPVAAALRSRYGLEGALAPLPAEWDQCFRLDAGPDGSFVVKLANRGHEDGVLELQNAALDHLARARLPVGIPRLVRSGDGAGTESIAAPEGPVRLRVLTWIEGEPLARHRPSGADLVRQLGRALGAVDACLQGFSHPSMDRAIDWDPRRASWIGGWLDAVEDRGRRALVARHLLRFRGALLPRLGLLPASVIHNDANDENVLVARTAGGSTRVSGLLDFGDMLRTHTVSEIAVAAAYAAFGSGDPAGLVMEMAEAYHEERPLSAEEARLILPLVCMRLCVSVVTAARAAREDPQNAHRQISVAPAWDLLDRLTGPSDVDLARTAVALPWSGHRASRDRDTSAQAPGSESVPEAGSLAGRRGRLLGRSLSLAYGAHPLVIVRGRGAWLYDERGRPFLDAVNNVCHVGHCHPRVVEALARQAAALNTNTRYLHPGILRYAERLTATLPAHLEVCFFVNSGSEANELAVRMARAHTGRRDALVVDHAYHGNTQTLVDLSPYKCEGPGGAGLPGWVRKIPAPDPLRGVHRGAGPGAGRAFALEVREAVEAMAAEGRPPAFFICEPILGCGGQIVPPEGFLREAFDHVRAAGGLCIADEVQTGLGRVGSHWWAFEAQGARPDIVTMGKPLGNGHPLGAVVTTREVAGSFANGMEYFNTFGGNPVSMAVGEAVLDVIEDERLRDRASLVGERMAGGFRRLAGRHEAIGDVRGMGLFLGVDIVRDRASLGPDGEAAARIVAEARREGVLLGVDGPGRNVIKIKPPMVFTEEDADHLLGVVDRALDAVPVA